jgi:hypothetical protein
VQKGQVDVALEMRAEPWGQVGALSCSRQLVSVRCISLNKCQEHTSLSFPIDSRECHEGTAENDNIGKGKDKALPINVEHDEKEVFEKENTVYLRAVIKTSVKKESEPAVYEECGID